MENIRKFKTGLKIEPTPNADLTLDQLGEFQVDSDNNKAVFNNGTSTSAVVTEAHTATLTNKTLTSPVINGGTINGVDINAASISLNDTDSAFNLEIQSTSTLTSDKTLTLDVNDGNRTLTVAGDATVSGTSSGTNTGDVTVSDTSTIDLSLTGQALSADVVAGSIGNTQLSTSILATKIADGSVDDTEFQYLNGVTSPIQTQLNAKVTGPASATDNAITRYDGTTGKLVQDSLVNISDAGVVSGATQLNIDNLRLDGNTLSSTDTNGNIVLDPDGTGSVQIAGLSTGVVHSDASGNLTSSAVNLATEVTGVLDETNGGTAQSTYTTGDILYASASNTLSKLAIGSTNDVLTVSSGIPAWSPSNASTPIQTINMNYNMDDSDSILRLDTSGGAITITIQAASGTNQDKIFRLVKVTSDYNVVTIAGALSTTIDTQGESIQIINDGTSWYIIERDIPNAVIDTSTQVIGAATTPPTKGTLAKDEAYRWRVGKYLYTQYTYNQTAGGSNGSGNYFFNVPSPLIVDTTFVATNFPTTSFASGNVGSGSIQANGTTASMVVQCTTGGDIVFQDPISGNNISDSFAQLGLATINYSAVWRVPIQGWKDGI